MTADLLPVDAMWQQKQPGLVTLHTRTCMDDGQAARGSCSTWNLGPVKAAVGWGDKGDRGLRVAATWGDVMGLLPPAGRVEAMGTLLVCVCARVGCGGEVVAWARVSSGFACVVVAGGDWCGGFVSVF